MHSLSNYIHINILITFLNVNFNIKILLKF